MPIHQVEVDQSGKIEDTRVATVVAFSDGIHRAVFVPAKVKRECIAILRARGKGKSAIVIYLFATVLYFLLKEYIEEIALAIIDIEYVGHSREIKQHLLNLLRRSGYTVSADQIRFGRIGKKSTAHQLAIETLRGRHIPDRRLTVESLWAEI